MNIDKNLYMVKTQDEINECFMKACLEGDLELVKFLLTDPELPLKAERMSFQDNIGVKIAHIEACTGNHLDILKYLFSLDNNKKTNYLENRNEAVLSVAAAYGHLNIIKFLLLDKDIDYIDLSSNSNAFVSACGSNQLEVVKYLTSSPEIKNHTATEHYNSGFEQACKNNCVDIVRYLMEDLSLSHNIGEFNYKKVMQDICNNNSIDVLDYLFKHSYLKENINIDYYFIKLVEDSSHTKNYDIINYLIFEDNLQMSQRLEKDLEDNENIKSWFKIRDLNNELNKEIPIKDLEKKPKIKI